MFKRNGKGRGKNRRGAQVAKGVWWHAVPPEHYKSRGLKCYFYRAPRTLYLSVSLIPSYSIS